jgi:2-amino-4-hydroxy-6-hydroxymethyldihydropteridine diphosphokinase
MTTVYLTLGSNVGDSPAHIRRAVELLGAFVRDIIQAPVYRSKAVGYTDQPDFLNTAIRGRTDLAPPELLAFVKDVEGRVGRTQTFRHGPREIDIDLIFYGDRRLETPALTIPHPAFRDRDFVLRPLADLDPGLIDPASGRTVSQLLAAIDGPDRSITGVA